MTAAKRSAAEGALRYLNHGVIDRALSTAGLPSVRRIIGGIFIFGTEESQVVGRIIGVEVPSSERLIIYTDLPEINGERLHGLVRDQNRGVWHALTQLGTTERIGIFELLR